MARLFDAARDREEFLRTCLKFIPSQIRYVSMSRTDKVSRPTKLELLEFLWAFRTAPRLFDKNGLFVGKAKKDGT